MNKFPAFLRDESGARAAEYVLILAIVGTALVTGVTALGTQITAALQGAADVIQANIPS